MIWMRNMKKILLTLAMLLVSLQGMATHVYGGELVWKCLPNGKFKFFLTMYRDCGGIDYSAVNHTITTNAPCGNFVVNRVVPDQFVAPVCFSSTTTAQAQCTGTGFGNYGTGTLQKIVFESGELTINGSPPAAGWYFYHSIFVRPSQLTNGGSNQNFIARAIMYPYTAPGATGPTSANPCFDSSPDFLEDPALLAVTNSDIVYNNLGYDPDLDSLYYDWADPIITFPSTPISWNAGYSSSSPLPTGAGSTGATLVGETGEVSFTSAQAGSFATCLKVESWRCGQKIGEIFRDIPISILSQTNPTGFCAATYQPGPPLLSLTPDASLVTPTVLTPITNLSGDTIAYQTSAYPGDTVKFEVLASDPYPNPNCNAQIITLSAAGGNLSSAANYGNASNCLFNPPCATLTSKNTGAYSGSFSSAQINKADFEWEIDCNHLFYQEFQCGALKSDYDFYFRMIDDQCPINEFSYAKVTVKVLNYMPRNVDITNACISQDPITGAVSFDWVNNVDTGFNYDYYLINHIDALGNTTVVDTIKDWTVQSYTHVGANPNEVNRYFIQTGGGCGLITPPSDTIQNIRVGLQAFPPPPNSSIARLDWNRWLLGDTSTNYAIWVEAPANSNIWTQLGSTQDTSWIDTVAFCGSWLNYQVRYNTTCESSLDSGFFSDKTEPNRILFDSVTVAGGNIASIAWQQSNDSDVVYYRILREDNNGFPVPVDSVLAANWAISMPWAYALSNAANQSEKYWVQAVDSCGNFSSLGTTTPSSTIYLQIGIDPCDGYARLRWNSYKEWTQTQPLEYNLYADITDPTGGIITGVLLKGGNLDTTFNHYGILNGFSYCYYVRAVDTTGTITSTSNRVCNSSAVVQGSKVLYLGRASVNSQNGVNMYAYIDKDADVIDYQVQRADDEIGPYLTIGSVVKPSLGPWEVKFVDYTADPMSRRYYYRITSRDSCGALDTVSNIATNILLNAEAVGNLTCALTWSAYRDFDAGVDEYEVYRSINGGNSFTYVTSTEDTSFIDDIKPFTNSKGKYCYYVRAIAKDGLIPWRDEFGEKFNARSNVACAVHKARLWFPTAFSPYSDFVENRIWKPQGVFARPDSYTMFIMDRWGQEVFRTNVIDQGWDGKTNGKDASMGMYTYYVKYRSIEDIPIEERGNFSLLY